MEQVEPTGYSIAPPVRHPWRKMDEKSDEPKMLASATAAKHQRKGVGSKWEMIIRNVLSPK